MIPLGVYSIELKKTGGVAQNMGILSFIVKKPTVEKPFEASYQAYYKPIVQKLISITGDVHVAEELAQEAFIKLYQNPPAHDQIEAWLKVVAGRSAYNYLRDQKRHDARLEAYETEVEQVAESAEGIYLRENQIRITRQALKTLSIKDRTCLLLKHSGYKYSEIADCLEMDVQAVGVLISRAQKKFKLAYEKLEGGQQP